MKLKILLSLLIAFTLTSQKTVYGQELDTICLNVSDVRILAASHEKLIFADSLIKIQDEEIELLRQVIEEKQNQENLHQGVLSTVRNEVTRLRRQRTFLSVGLGGVVVALLIFIL